MSAFSNTGRRPLLAVTAARRRPVPHIAKRRFPAQCGRGLPSRPLPGDLRTQRRIPDSGRKMENPTHTGPCDLRKPTNQNSGTGHTGGQRLSHRLAPPADDISKWVGCTA
jgi:hypothetical protein